MYKIVPIHPDLVLKTYWCADLPAAEKVANELKDRTGCHCDVVSVPEKKTWTFFSENTSDEIVANRIVIKLNSDSEFYCTKKALNDAITHANSNVLKITNPWEIFCFTPNDPFWQQQYFHDSTY